MTDDQKVTRVNEHGSLGLKEARDKDSALQARLLVLNSRANKYGRTMQDRSKSQAARDAAGAKWAEARRDAEKVKRELREVRKRIKEIESGGRADATDPADHESTSPVEDDKDVPETGGEAGTTDDQQAEERMEKTDLGREEMAVRIELAYKSLVLTRRDLVGTQQALAEHERAARVQNAETLLEARNERSAALYLEGILDSPQTRELTAAKRRAELAHYEARSEVERLELLVRLLEATPQG